MSVPDRWMSYVEAAKAEFHRHLQEVKLGIGYMTKPTPQQLYEYAKTLAVSCDKYKNNITAEDIERFNPEKYEEPGEAIWRSLK